MNRLTTVLYPTQSGSGSEGSGTAQHTPGLSTVSDPQRAGLTPIDTGSGAFGSSSSFSIHVPADGSVSIYDDPRSTRFDSPQLTRAHSDVGPGASGAATPNGDGDHRQPQSYAQAALSSLHPHINHAHGHTHNHSHQHNRSTSLLRHLSDDGTGLSRSSIARRSASASGYTTRRGSGEEITRRDRSLRVNLMQAAASPPRGKRGSVVATGTGGRLSSMAQGPRGRYVVGGGQYLRVLEISNPDTDTSQRAGRQAGTPFARGPGGAAISEVVNLWRGSWAVGKGVNDVDWGVANFDTKIVTATPSGNFMIFDVNRGKLDREVGGGHPRPMNCIETCKTNAYAYLLLTGGTEGQARLWDMRDAEPINRKYYKHNAAVTAITFCADDQHQFVVGTEAGNLFHYDYRVPNKAIGKLWGAHGSKPVYDLKWKVAEDDYAPPGQGWLASAGGDRSVQVWDMSRPWEKGTTPTHILHTAHQIRCVDWRPGHPTEIAVVPFDQGTATLPDPTKPMGPPQLPDESDATLEVWDVRRHYIAKYALPGYDGNAVAAIWDDDESIVAAFRNGGLVQIDMNSRTAPKTLPLESIPRQVVSWSPKGELAYAIDRFKLGEVPFDDVKAEYAAHWQVGQQNRKSIADRKFQPVQTLGHLVMPDTDDDEYIYMAQHYRLEGDSPENLCKWNREVAEICGRMDEGRLWDLLQGVIEEFSTSSKSDGIFNEAVFSQTAAPAIVVAQPAESPHGMDGSPGGPSELGHIEGIPLEPADEDIVAPDADDYGLEESTVSGSSESSGPPTPPPKTRFKAFVPPSLTPTANSASNGRPTFSRNDTSGSYLRPLAKKLTIETPFTESSDDAPTPTADMDYPDPYGIAAALEMIAQPKAKKPKRTRGGKTSRSTPSSTRPSSPKPERAAVPPSALAGARSAAGSAQGSKRPSIVGQTKERLQAAALTRQVQGSYSLERWESYKESRCAALLDWWRSYVDDGEMQIASVVFIVGSPVIHFPQQQAERVLDGYLDQLERYRLSVPVAYVRRFANVLAAQTLAGMEGITHILHCAKCGKSTGSLEDTADTKKFWYCTKCRRGAKICVVCRETVKGLWMGCNKCRHGGHQRCMRLYYLETEKTTPILPLPAPPATSQSRAPSPALGRRHSAPGHGSSTESATTERDKERGDKERGEDNDGEGGEEIVVGKNTCPTGCGCQCRTVERRRRLEPDGPDSGHAADDVW